MEPMILERCDRNMGQGDCFFISNGELLILTVLELDARGSAAVEAAACGAGGHLLMG